MKKIFLSSLLIGMIILDSCDSKAGHYIKKGKRSFYKPWTLLGTVFLSMNYANASVSIPTRPPGHRMEEIRTQVKNVRRINSEEFDKWR